MSDRVAMIQGGNIVQIGAPSVFHAPTNRFVADFVGKMSFVGGEIVSFEDDGMLRAIGRRRICPDRFCRCGTGGTPA